MGKIVLYGFFYVPIEGIPRFMTKFITHISVIEDTYDYIFTIVLTDELKRTHSCFGHYVAHIILQS